MSIYLKAGFELPTYEEAEELRLHPDKLPDDYLRRLSLVHSSAKNSAANLRPDLNLRPELDVLRRHSCPSNSQTEQQHQHQQLLSNSN
jgi:hypothetical protein